MEWDHHAVDLDRLCQRLHWYGRNHDVSPATLASLEGIMRSATVHELLKLPPTEWDEVLVNDLYKVTMHQMYAKYLRGVTAEFALHVRRGPMTLCELGRRHPRLMEQLQAHVAHVTHVEPYSPCVQGALAVHLNGFQLGKELACMSAAHGVAPVTWSAECCAGITSAAPHPAGAPLQGERCEGVGVGVGDGVGEAIPEQQAQECDVSLVGPWINLQDHDCSCITAGPIDAASHTETTIMQLVQAAFIRAQVEEIQQQYCAQQQQQQQQQGTGPPSGGQGVGVGVGVTCVTCWPDRTELLGSCLAHLGHVIDTLNSQDHGLRISLFAGRRSSDRLFLVVQNLAFAQLVRGYAGTSSVYAAAMLAKAWDVLGVSAEQRLAQLGPLVGTHAHEQSSIVQQLMADVDWKGGQEAQAPPSGPLPPLPQGALSSLLAHLLYLATSGDLPAATALPDTFGTRAWLAVALACDVPQELVDDLRTTHGVLVPSGAKCFDLFRVWRIDSGSYEEIAGLVVSAWEHRCQVLAAGTAAAAAAAAGGGAGSGGGSACPPAAGAPPALPRPVLMHSNLGSVQEVMQVAQLPERIRPQVLAFGTLADGFFPLVPPHDSNAIITAGSGGRPADPGSQGTPLKRARTGDEGYPIRLASVVMKAVQARAPKVTVTQASALKLGDPPPGSTTGGKLERDPRLGPAALAQVHALAARLGREASALDLALGGTLDAGGDVSGALREAYRRVAHEGLLQP